MKTGSYPSLRFVVICLFCLTGFSVHAATLPAGFSETQFGSNLNPGNPTAMDFAPDGRLFVCLQSGQLRVIKNGALLPTPFVSLNVDDSGERGLLGIAFDPNFASNQFVYLYHTVPGSPPHNRITRGNADGDVAAAGSQTTILDLDNLSSATNHNGGAIHFGPDGKLYVNVGENANASNAQSLNNRLGKVLRINPDGSVPDDNPTSFPGISGSPTGANRAIWAVGLRNPFTFAFQPGTGRMFVNDVGQSTWEEINDGIAGSNYGWPNCEGTCSPANPNYRDPLYRYNHGGNPGGCAIIGGAFYNPPINPFPISYLGKYFFGDLCGGWIRIFDPTSGNSTEFATDISTLIDLKVGADGNLYYLARGSNGQVWKVSATAGSQALNISSRSRVGTGSDVMIGGFIIDGTANKRVIARAIGPSLQQFNVPGPLSDPFLELRDDTGGLLSSNNNWRDTQETEIINSQLAPTDNLESAIIATLAPGSYTAVVSGNNTTSGAGLVEIYDLDTAAASRLANISTRSMVQTGDNRLIGGFILGGNNSGLANVIVRAIGPSLAKAGVTNPLADPTLELRNSNGGLILSNDNWQDDAEQAAQLAASGLAPGNPVESAIAASLPPASYTAIVAGKNGGTGTGLVEIYNLP